MEIKTPIPTRRVLIIIQWVQYFNEKQKKKAFCGHIGTAVHQFSLKPDHLLWNKEITSIQHHNVQPFIYIGHMNKCSSN